MAGRGQTPDMLGGQAEVVDVTAVLGHEPIVVVDEFSWEGYGGLPEATADKLRAVTRTYQRAMRSLGNSVVGAGRALVEAKGLLEHGAWSEWLQVEAQLTEQQARAMMNIATRFGELPAGLQISPSALALLAAPSVPEEVRAEVLEQAQERPVTVQEVRATIVGAQEAKQKWEDEGRKMAAVEAVMQWVEGLPERERANALGNWKLKANRKRMRAFVQGFTEEEISSAVAHCRQHLARLLRERGAAAAQPSRTGTTRGPERVGVSKPTAERRTVSGATSEPRSNGAAWYDVEIAEQEILHDLLGGNGRRVRVTEEGQLEITALNGQTVILAAVLDHGEAVLRWTVKLNR